MNTSEEKQLIILGRVLKRDPDRIKWLLNQNKLLIIPEALEFVSNLLEYNVVNNDVIENVYNNLTKDDVDPNYKRIMEILLIG